MDQTRSDPIEVCQLLWKGFGTPRQDPHETPTGRERATGLGIQFLQFTYVGTPFGAGEQTQSSDVDFTSKNFKDQLERAEQGLHLKDRF